MLCLPVFIILLLLASSAAPNPLETRIQGDLIRADLEDADTQPDEWNFSSIADNVFKVAPALAGAIIPIIADLLRGGVVVQ
uniref:Conotoxin n=1 Tax=Conus magus TaxID=6492 RepID=A0A679P5X9_CONMA|nr:TPA_inf: conotoxin superfamily T [Conus magus]